MVIIMDNTDT